MTNLGTQTGLSRRRALLSGAGLTAGAATMMMPGAHVHAQTPATPAAGGAMTASRTTLTVDGAVAVMQAALAHAKDIGVPEVVAVVDHQGILMAFARMEEALIASYDFAQQKALTAASFRAPTDQFAKGVGSDPTVVGSLLKATNVTLLGGGLPLMMGDVLVGGIGCSGGSVEQDIACAQAGVAALSGE